MRRLFATALICLLASGNLATAQPVPPAPAGQPAVEPARAPIPGTLLDGTAIKLRLGENLSSETNKTGDQIPFEVIEEVTVDGIVIIPKSTPALATITNAEPKKRMGRGGKLDVNVDSVRLADGEKAQLRAVQDKSGGGHVGAMTGAMVATSLVFFPAAPLFLFMHGKSVEIPKGTEITAFVQGDMKLEMARFAPAPPAGSSSPASANSLAIDASVPNCDIQIDGAFAGNTPSVINLAPGQHEIVVKKPGYKDWVRSMTLSSGAIHLNADMQPTP